MYLDCWKVCIILCKMPFLQISNELSTISKHSVQGKLFIVCIVCIFHSLPHLICQGFGTGTVYTAVRMMTVVAQRAGT